MDEQQSHSRTVGASGRRWPPCHWVVFLLFALAASPALAQTSSPAELKTLLDKALRVPTPSNMKLGASVIELDSGRVLYDHRAEVPMIPASNMKLVIMAAAVDALGVDYRHETVLAIRGTDVVVIGSGDPTFGDEVLAAKHGKSVTAVFHEWAEKLDEAGIRQIPGNIVVDDLIFDLKFTHPSWPKNQYQSWYEAPIGGLNFNANCVRVEVSPTQPGQPAALKMIPGNTALTIRNNTKTDKKNTVVVARGRHSDELVVSGKVARKGTLKEITVRDPGIYFGSVLKTVLAAKGIRVGGKVIREKVRLDSGMLPMDCHVVAVHRAPIADALYRSGKRSVGMMAEGLYKTLGAHQGGVGTWASGKSAVHAFLREAGVPASQVTVDDGSGLSRKNRLSAAAATRILRYIANTDEEKLGLLRQSLATSGVDGTLVKRLKGPKTKGRILGKTGTINGVRTLAGLIHTQDDRWLAFAFFYNFSGKAASPKPWMDQACRLLVDWTAAPK